VKKTNQKELHKRVLEMAAVNQLPKQFSSMGDILVCVDLIDRGCLEGTVLRDSKGNIMNVGGARITGDGREYLDTLRSVNVLDKIKKRPVVILLLAVLAAIGSVAAFTGNLIKIWEFLVSIFK
jgi:hypothetical protein